MQKLVRKPNLEIFCSKKERHNCFKTSQFPPPLRRAGLNVSLPPVEESSTILLACPRGDYSASRIARAVEDCDAHLQTSTLLPARRENFDNRIIAERVSHRNPESVGRSLERYGYEVVDAEGAPLADDSPQRSRYDALICTILVSETPPWPPAFNPRSTALKIYFPIQPPDLDFMKIAILASAVRLLTTSGISQFFPTVSAALSTSLQNGIDRRFYEALVRQTGVPD